MVIQYIQWICSLIQWNWKRNDSKSTHLIWVIFELCNKVCCVPYCMQSAPNRDSTVKQKICHIQQILDVCTIRTSFCMINYTPKGVLRYTSDLIMFKACNLKYVYIPVPNQQLNDNIKKKWIPMDLIWI